MSSFKDEAYEKLDYLSQLTEVVVAPQNEVLASIPDRTEISYDTLKTLLSNVHFSSFGLELTVESVLRHFYWTTTNFDNRLLSEIAEHFELAYSEDFELDFFRNTMKGTLCLNKISHQMDDRKMLKLAVERALKHLDRYSWPKNTKEHAVALLNLLEPEAAQTFLQDKNFGGWAIKDKLVTAFSSSILENKWRVRDSSVIEKMGEWMQAHMVHQDGGIGFVNLMKLKLMLNKELPVYSLEEVKKLNGNPA